MNNRSNLVRLNNRRTANKSSLIKPIGAQTPLVGDMVQVKKGEADASKLEDQNIKCVGKRTNRLMSSFANGWVGRRSTSSIQDQIENGDIPHNEDVVILLKT